MKKINKKCVVFVGGETAGPIMPLLAIAQSWKSKDPKIEPVFFDRRISVGARLAPSRGYKFFAIPAGKLRRYWTWRNFVSPFLLVAGFVHAMYLLIKLRPVLVMGAGGYVQVPVIIAAWLLGIPRIIHQQDIVPTFSNKLVSPLANKITTTFEKSVKDFPQGSGFEKDFGSHTKIFWTGNPCNLNRDYLRSTEAKKEAIKLFKLDPEWATILVIGGGSGARGLNQVVAHNLPGLLKTAQIIHASGVGKMIEPPHDMPEVHDRYHQYEFIDRIDLAYAAADVIIARAGVGTITDIAQLGKAAIFVPMPNSHQELNAHYLFDANAGVILDQNQITPELLTKVVRKIFFDAKLQQEMQTNITKIMPVDSTERIFAVINSLLDGRK